MRYTTLLLLIACANDEADPTRDSGPTVGADDTAGAVYDAPQVEGISTRIHEDFGSLIYIAWEQGADATVWVEFSVDAGQWRSTPPVDAAAGPQEHLLLGVPYGAEVTYRVVNDFGRSGDPAGALTTDEATASADPAPEGAPQARMHAAVDGGWDADGRFLFTSLWEWVVIIDRQGRLVWAQEMPRGRIVMFAQPSADGADLLVDYNSFWGAFDVGAESQVRRIKIDGTVAHTYDTPGMHHPFIDLPDGSVVWGAAVSTYMDETLEKVGLDGARETLWSCADFLADEGASQGNYCGSNTIAWSEATDSFLYSFYSLDSVVEVDHATGGTLRTFGHVGDAWAFDPPESAFWWQHGAHYTADGNLLLSSIISERGDETVAREYRLDEATETLVEVWSFGEDQGVYGDTGGEAHRLPGGNTLHNYGEALRVREVTPGGEVVWDVSWSRVGWLGKSELLEDLYDFAP